MSAQGDVTRLLQNWRQGDELARSQLFDLMYEQIHQIAQGVLWSDQQRRIVQPTELVNECSLRLLNIQALDWQDRSHFLAMVVTTMRRVLIDQARKRSTSKRKGSEVTLITSHLGRGDESAAIDLLALDEALERLAEESRDKALIVELKYFGGLSNREIAEVIGTSEASVSRGWRWSRVWLYM